jgi:feruloyl esterase
MNRVLVCIGVMLAMAGTIPAQRPARAQPATASALADLKGVAPIMECAGIQSVDLAAAAGVQTRIRTATAVADGRPAPYCRVQGTIDPAIQFEVRLPLQNWTQRFLQTGCGGLCGTLNINVGRAEGCVPATNGELALASTDMGHSGGSAADPAWAVDNPQTRIDFAYRAVHLTTLAAKALIQKYYGQPPRYSYFSGCSDGGREALMEAQRYPEDFDGIAAGAPAMNFITQNTFYHAWNARKNTGADGRAILTSDKLPVLHRAAVEACDRLDGLVDGLISDPPACAFDPSVTICTPGQDESKCLTSAQALAAKEIYRGAHDDSGRKFVISGPQPGSELAWQDVFVPSGADGNIFSARIALGTIKYLASWIPRPAGYTLEDFQFDAATFDAVKPMHGIYDATNPDLSKFEAAGGKLLLYHGWSDPHISPLNSVAYYTAMQRLMGEAVVSRFARLFLFPGGYHCNGGDGPFDFALLSTLMNWVEGGVAPDAIVASHSTGGTSGGRGIDGPGRRREDLAGRGPQPPATIDRARPVFAYPWVAAYRGRGDIDVAASFEGKPGPKVAPAQLDWLGAPFYSAGYEQWCEWNGAAMDCSSRRK